MDSSDPFAGPTENPRESVRVVSEAGDRPLRVNGRYALPDPETGEPRSWQSVTNFVRALDDAFALARWSESRVAWGLAQRPGLTTYAASLTLGDEDRNELADVVRDAKEAAASAEGAHRGKALHKWTERLESGAIPVMRVRDVPEDVRPDLAAYVDTMNASGLMTFPEYIERTTCVPQVGAAGTFDRLLRTVSSGRRICPQCPPNILHVGDLKTGANELKYGALKTSMQMALYANGVALWDRKAEAWTPMPAVCLHVGVMMHLPVGTGECTLHYVDLAAGWHLCRLAAQVIAARKTKNLFTPWES